MFCAATFSNSYIKWRLRYVMLRFLAVPADPFLGQVGGFDFLGPNGQMALAWLLDAISQAKKVLISRT